eukprot:gnl/TRDRNA2_/TRDRNA2_185068_c0_seq1.p1 gnl/TRDRNA2_/TRDRNA2_185068_c0~~gnl/TRDRNA2_/TRDRNA2_185068_c0_seq1.p1  ORF type:complete len:362 (-),score=51.15 gnl/TRDRNA2_/TRDRNA2_185068_c0_seq1:244-1329(-)
MIRILSLFAVLHLGSSIRFRTTRSDARRDQEHDNSVVMGLCSYKEGPRGHCQYFVKSLRKTGFTGAILLGVTPDLGLEDLAWIRNYNVTAKKVRGTACSNTAIQRNTVCMPNDPNIPIALGRFQLYKEWLEEHNYEYAMLSDTADVFFQTNPFTHLKLNKSAPMIEVASEWGWDSPEDRAADEGKMKGSTIAWSGFNRGWIENCLGAEALKKVQHQQVLCSGTTVGTKSGMEAYLALMNKEITAALARPDPRWGCTELGVDQGFHNFVLHSIAKTNPNITVVTPSYGDGTMLTIGQMCMPPPSKKKSFVETMHRDHSWTQLARDAEGFVLMNDGSRAPVVHQYDRCWVQFAESGWLQKIFG